MFTDSIIAQQQLIPVSCWSPSSILVSDVGSGGRLLISASPPMDAACLSGFFCFSLILLFQDLFPKGSPMHEPRMDKGAGSEWYAVRVMRCPRAACGGPPPAAAIPPRRAAGCTVRAAGLPRLLHGGRRPRPPQLSPHQGPRYRTHPRPPLLAAPVLPAPRTPTPGPRLPRPMGAPGAPDGGPTPAHQVRVWAWRGHNGNREAEGGTSAKRSPVLAATPAAGVAAALFLGAASATWDGCGEARCAEGVQRTGPTALGVVRALDGRGALT